MPVRTNKKRYNIVYLTTNEINKKKYIGCHSTNDINDGYIGSGIKSQNMAQTYINNGVSSDFVRAVVEFGYSNFSVKILSIHNTIEEALKEEERLVTREWLERNDTYNMNLGGDKTRPKKIISRTEVASIILLYKTGENIDEICLKHKIDKHYLFKITKHIPRIKSKSDRQKLSEKIFREEIDDIVESYKKGESKESLNKRFKTYIHSERVKKILDEIIFPPNFICITPNNDKIEFYTAKDISIILNTKLFHSGITECCKGNISNYKGYNFYFYSEFKNGILRNKNITTPVTIHSGIQFRNKDGEIFVVKNNLSEFCREHGLTFELILRVIKGNLSQHKGFTYVTK